MRAKKDKKLIPDGKPVEEDEGDDDKGEGDEAEDHPAKASKKRKVPDVPESGQFTFFL
jgi:hypothetical protein